MNDKWITDIKRKADSYERKAPDDMLDNIKQEMARRGLTMTPPRPIAQTRRLTWQRWAVAASLAVAVGGTAVYLALLQPDSDTMLSQQLQHREPATQVQRQASANVEQHTAQPASIPTSSLIVQVLSKNHGKRTMPSASMITEEYKAKNVSNPQSASVENNTVETKDANTVVEIETRKAAEQQRTSANQSQNSYKDHWDSSDRLLAYNNESPHHTIHVGAYYQGVGGFQRNGNSNGQVMTMSDPMVASVPVLYAYPSLLTKVLQETPMHSEKHHHLPVRAGLSVSIPLNGQWGVTTGLTYSTMSSDFEDLYANHRESSTQRLHYLGIPVSVHYNVWQQSKVKVYASAGGEIEKLVYGKKKTHYADMTTNETITTTISEHRPVLSTHVHAGISYSVLPSLSLFAEPGLSYHFKNGSGVKSAYTDKQLLFNVNVGVRFGK
ncbi:outer membrane beta-barrel protein [Hallella mizrahii]|uniref:PorT family protein n=1 Tax=Hallella mizrahii TaxID=2606637 RepID=A0A7K0KGE8_9BACT|nr:outer membrane beta-barrel protein [Hallella mizrahii]MST84545.1 PorT family protein [Hallella mizrahii]